MTDAEVRIAAWKEWELHQKECGFDGNYCSYCSGEDEAKESWDNTDGFELFLAKFKRNHENK